MAAPPAVLSLAGSDPSGGAGIQADLKTFHAFGVYGMAVITCLTAQNTRGVTGIHEVSPEFVAEQLRAVFDDVPVAAVKTGMLKSEEIIRVVAREMGGHPALDLVVDPVMVATSGDRLIDEAAVKTLRDHLLPLAGLVTPNRAEAAVLVDRDVTTLADARSAGESILATGCEAVLIKGIPAADAMVDLLITGTGEREFRLPAMDTGATHGTGCTLSAALASGLALGLPLAAAVARAKSFVWRGMRDAYAVGEGSLPVDHLVPSEDHEV